MQGMPPLRPLCLVIKLFLQQRGLNEVWIFRLRFAFPPSCIRCPAKLASGHCRASCVLMCFRDTWAWCTFHTGSLSWALLGGPACLSGCPLSSVPWTRTGVHWWPRILRTARHAHGSPPGPLAPPASSHQAPHHLPRHLCLLIRAPCKALP